MALFNRDPSAGLFGTTLRNLGITKDFGISELLGGQRQSFNRSQQLGGSNVQGPIFPESVATGGASIRDIPSTTPRGGNDISIGDTLGTSSAGAQVSTGQDSQGRQTFIDPTSGEERTKKTDEGSILSLIDESFQQESDFLGGLAEQAQGQFGEARGALTGQFETFQGLAGQERQQRLGELEGQRTQVGLEQQQGNVRIKNLLRDLQQRGNALLAASGRGGSSSARALSDRVGSTALQQVGALNTQVQQSLQSISNESGRVNTFFDNKTAELRKSLQDGLIDLEGQLSSRLASIDQSRAASQRAKNEAKIDTWNNYLNSVQQFKSQVFSFEQQLTAWAVEKGQALDEAMNFATQQTQGVNPEQFGILPPNAGIAPEPQQGGLRASNVPVSGVQVNLADEDEENAGLGGFGTLPTSIGLA